MSEPVSTTAAVQDRVLLEFVAADRLEHVDSPLRRNISAAAISGRTLFVACDETASVERLVFDGERFADHCNVNLSQFFELPDGPRGEMDIEGLAVDEDYLWIVGSHSLRRDKPDAQSEDSASALEALTDIKHSENRYFLGRVPLERDEHGGCRLVATCRRNGRTLRAACIRMTRGTNRLMRILKHDEHFGPFLNVPCKENGFDIEGLAVRDDCVFLGLRGPVLRGWAIVLQLSLKATRKGRLKPRRFRDSGRRYIKHFIDLDGLGIRDLLLDGNDLLILAGPTMDLDGPAAVYRWRDAAHARHHSLTRRDELERLLQLPCGTGEDHPESIALWPERADAPLFVVYDSPARTRLRERQALDADLFALGGTA